VSECQITIDAWSKAAHSINQQIGFKSMTASGGRNITKCGIWSCRSTIPCVHHKRYASSCRVRVSPEYFLIDLRDSIAERSSNGGIDISIGCGSEMNLASSGTGFSR
jgi:hypothetical protein